jgi:hypothetical protein
MSIPAAKGLIKGIENDTKLKICRGTLKKSESFFCLNFAESHY